MIGSAGLRYIQETTVSDGRGGTKTVRCGENVELLPFEQTRVGKERDDYIAENAYDTQKRDLGTGPYKIAHIGLWPCGRIMLYLKTATSSGTGCYAEDFMAI